MPLEFGNLVNSIRNLFISVHWLPGALVCHIKNTPQVLGRDWRSLLPAKLEWTFSQCSPQSYVCNFCSKCDLKKIKRTQWSKSYPICLSLTLMIFYGQKKIPLFSPHQEVSTIVLWHMLEAPFVRPQEEKVKRNRKKLSSEASRPDQAWLDCVFFATAVAWVTLHRPRWPSTISNRQSKWEPLISSSPPLTPPSL